MLKNLATANYAKLESDLHHTCTLTTARLSKGTNGVTVITKISKIHSEILKSVLYCLYKRIELGKGEAYGNNADCSCGKQTEQYADGR